MLETRRSWLARRGSHYLFVIAPDKHSIYAEYLGEKVRREGSATRFDQLLVHLRARSDVALLDLRPALLEAKRKGRVYHRTDTHWNEYGAYTAYREIMGSLGGWFPGARPAPLADFRMIREDSRGGDLALLLGLPELLREERIRLHPLHSRRARRIPFRIDRKRRRAGRPKVLGRAEAPLPGAVMFMDSFGNYLIPYLAEHFTRIAILERQIDPAELFDTGLIGQERPRLVIQQITERVLLRPVPARLPEG